MQHTLSEDGRNGKKRLNICPNLAFIALEDVQSFCLCGDMSSHYDSQLKVTIDLNSNDSKDDDYFPHFTLLSQINKILLCESSKLDPKNMIKLPSEESCNKGLRTKLITIEFAFSLAKTLFYEAQVELNANQ